MTSEDSGDALFVSEFGLSTLRACFECMEEASSPAMSGDGRLVGVGSVPGNSILPFFLPILYEERQSAAEMGSATTRVHSSASK